MKRESLFTSWLNLVVIVAGGVSALLGLVVMVGWYTQNVKLVQVSPIFVPMQFNTGLGFLLCGTGLLLLVYGRQQAAIICGVVVGAVSLLTLIEYLFGVDIGIDQLFMEHFTAVKTTHPGRMAPSTALSFVLGGMTLLIASRLVLLRQRPLILGLLGSLIGALGVGTFFGYLTGLETPYGWAHATYMAVHTAAGFAVLGAGFFAFAWRLGTAEKGGMARWLAIPIGVGVLAVTLALWQALVIQERNRIEQMITEKAGSLRTEIKKLVEPRILSLVRMREDWEFRGKQPQGDWENHAALHYTHEPGYQAIEWVDPSFYVRWVVPLKGNEVDLNHDLGLEEKQRLLLEVARNRKELAITHSVDLLQGGKGFFVYVPLFPKESFEGFIRGVFCTQKLLDPLLSEEAPSGYSLVVFDGDKEIYGRYDAGRELEVKWGKEVKVELHGITWRVRVWPEAEMLSEAQSFLPTVGLIVGLLMAFLLTLTVYLGQMTQLRTKEVERANQGLERQMAERKRVEEKLRAITESLEQRTVELESTNKELEGFSYSVSHDLRAPLHHMSGFANLLQELTTTSLDEKGRRYVKIILESVQQMDCLIDDLLDFSRAGRAEMNKSRVSLGKLVEEVWHDLQEETEGRNIDWKVGPLPEVYADRSMLRLVLVNLISNALKFTRPRAQTQIEIKCTSDKENEIIFSIRDNGVGFDMKYIDRLFRVFQRLHRIEEFEGTGIGLANVQRIIHRHGGRTWAEGSVDGGATFYFALPRLRGEKGEH